MLTISRSISFRLGAVLIACLMAALYLPFLNNPMVFDDAGLFGPIGTRAELGSIFSIRGLPYFTFGVTWVFLGEDIPIFRFQNFLLHGLNVWMVWKLIKVWAEIFLVDPLERERFIGRAWFGAAVFAVHPLATYGVGYLVQRSILMATFFTLLMQIGYLRSLIDGDKRLLILAVVAYLLAVYSKEHSLMAPMILLPLTWHYWSRKKLQLGALSGGWFGFVAVGVLVILQIKGVLGTPYEPDVKSILMQQEVSLSSEELHFMSLLTQAGLFFKYCLLMLLPNPSLMSIDIREEILSNWSDWRNWLGLAGFSIYGVVGVWGLLRGGKFGLVGLAFLYPWCHFFVEFSTIRLQEIFVLYRSYLWLPGFMLFSVLLIDHNRAKIMTVVGTLILCMLFLFSWNRLWVMADEYRVWDDAAKLLRRGDEPGAARIYYARGQASAARGNGSSAIADLRRSKKLSPEKMEIRLALASAYFINNLHQEALKELNEVIRIEPMNAKAHYNKGILLHQSGSSGYRDEWQKSCDLGAILACSALIFEDIRKGRVSADIVSTDNSFSP